MKLDTASLPPEFSQAFAAMEAEIARLRVVVNLKDEQIRLLNIRLWGPKADKLSDNQLALLPEELLVAAPEVEREAELPDPQKEGFNGGGPVLLTNGRGGRLWTHGATAPHPCL